MSDTPNINANFFSQFSLNCHKKENDDRIIFSSAKCGSRYFNDLQSTEGFIPLPVHEVNWEQTKEIIWVVRPPLEHFLSAIITEHNINMQTFNHPLQTTSKIKVKKREEEWVSEILYKLLVDILTEPKFSFNTNGKINYFGHYEPRYEKLYKEIEYKLDVFSKIRFVELSNISDVLISEFDVTHTPNKDEYSFDLYFTKQTLLKKLETDYSDLWKELKTIIDGEIIYYDLLLNYDYNVLFKKKLKELYNNIEQNTKLYTAYKLRNIKIDMYKLLKIN